MSGKRLAQSAALLIALTSTLSLLALAVVATSAPIPESRPSAIGGIVQPPSPIATKATPWPSPSPDRSAQPTLMPTPNVEPTPTAEPTPTPVATPSPPSDASALVVTTPTVRFAKTSRVPRVGVPAVVSWSLPGGQLGLRRYDLQVQHGGGGFLPVALSSGRATSRAVTLQAGRTYIYRVRAVDTAGRAGTWKAVGPGVGLDISDASSSITWKGAWSSISLNAYLGGTGHSTGAKGATATLRFSGTRVAWVGPMGPTRGRAQVFIDGRLVTTVDLWAASFHPRRMVFTAAVRPGSHTLVIKALGTAGRSTVNVDSIFVIQPD